jgi:hypothetical protein
MPFGDQPIEHGDCYAGIGFLRLARALVGFADAFNLSRGQTFLGFADTHTFTADKFS